MSNLILPGTLEYSLAVQDLPPPPGWLNQAHRTGGDMAIIALPGSNGVMQCVSLDRAMEFIHDGELDQRMDEIEELEDMEYVPDLWLPGDPLEI